MRNSTAGLGDPLSSSTQEYGGSVSAQTWDNQVSSSIPTSASHMTALGEVLYLSSQAGSSSVKWKCNAAPSDPTEFL